MFDLYYRLVESGKQLQACGGNNQSARLITIESASKRSKIQAEEGSSSFGPSTHQLFIVVVHTMTATPMHDDCCKSYALLGMTL